MIGKTRCLDGLLVDDRVMELCEYHLGAAFELSICVSHRLRHRHRHCRLRTPTLPALGPLP
eukprot:COSAG06_NODE_360_length_16832_cov_9.250209_25_plen_61_part_00